MLFNVVLQKVRTTSRNNPLGPALFLQALHARVNALDGTVSHGIIGRYRVRCADRRRRCIECKALDRALIGA